MTNNLEGPGVAVGREEKSLSMVDAEMLASAKELSWSGSEGFGVRDEPLRSLKLEAEEPLLLSLSLFLGTIPIRRPKPWGWACLVEIAGGLDDLAASVGLRAGC